MIVHILHFKVTYADEEIDIIPFKYNRDFIATGLVKRISELRKKFFLKI